MKNRELLAAPITLAAVCQLGVVALCVPFLLLRSLYPPVGNVVGLDANLALLGFGLLLMGLFNGCFFPLYYKDPRKVGKPFLVGAAVLFSGIGITEALPHFVPFVRDRLDTALFLFLPEKLLCLFLGAGLYALLTGLACRKSAVSFEKLDLS